MKAQEQPYGVAIIGAGWVSGEHIKAFQKNPRTRVVGIYSRSADAARKKLEEHGVQGRVYDALDQVLADRSIQIVSVCSPPDVHADQVIRAAAAGKHMVIEKPLAMNREDVAAMVSAVDRAGVSTVVSFVLRWNPMIQTTKRLLEDDAVGRISYVEADYWHWIGPHYAQYRWARTKAVGGASLLSAGCHAVDAMRWLAGEIQEVFGYSAKGFPGSDYEFDPNLAAVVKFRSGAVGKVSSILECKTPYVFNVHIVGDKGTIRNNKVFSHAFPGQTGYLEYPTILPDSGDVTHHPFVHEIDHFVECLDTGRKAITEIRDAQKTMEVCFGISDSVREGRPVSLKAS